VQFSNFAIQAVPAIVQFSNFAIQAIQAVPAIVQFSSSAIMQLCNSKNPSQKLVGDDLSHNLYLLP
jgi:hypothetical protein